MDNIIARDFHTDAPNKKWLTDLTEFHIPAGKVYLSPIIDCYDGMVVSWAIGASPNAELVNTMLDYAICCLLEDEKPVIHSERGCHYRWPGWVSRMENASLTRSMSKKGCSPDNSACEGFFGRLKNEMFYNRSWQDVSIEGFTSILDEYIQWYNEKRIKMSLGGAEPFRVPPKSWIGRLIYTSFRPHPLLCIFRPPLTSLLCFNIIIKSDMMSNNNIRF